MTSPSDPTREESAGSPDNTPVHGYWLDRWADRYAERARGMTASEIRALFAVASRPEVVSLAGGMPYLNALPMDAVAESVSELVSQQGTVALQYGSGQGDPQLREQIIDVMAAQQVHADPDDIVITTGSQQALDLVTRILIDPGDVVITEAPSYVGALGVFRSYQADIVHVPFDDAGLIPAALEETMRTLQAQGKNPKFLYTVPNYHNPAGVTLSAQRRPQIVEIAQRYDIAILEDDPYGLLSFDGQVLPSLYSFAPDNVIYLGSFSKTFAPGFRVGWAVAPASMLRKLVLANESAVLSPSSFSQMAVSRYLATNDWQHQVDVYRKLYQERAHTMLSALEEFIPQAQWTHPTGGFYVWVTLPEGLDAAAMLPRAVSARVAYVPGTAFYADGQGRQQMRLSYCHPTPERIHEGVRRLSGVVKAELDILRSFPPTDPHGIGHFQPASPSPDVV